MYNPLGIKPEILIKFKCLNLYATLACTLMSNEI